MKSVSPESDIVLAPNEFGKEGVVAVVVAFDCWDDGEVDFFFFLRVSGTS